MIVPLVLVCNEEYWLPYVLEASRGHFERYVIYDVGSTDRTREVIDWFRDTSPGVDFVVRFLPMSPPVVQGTFRNAMIAEALSSHYLILDGDEVYDERSYKALLGAPAMMCNRHLYGIVRRCEWVPDLTSAYGLTQPNKHHRIYRSRAIFGGTHPGEYPIPKITPRNETWAADVTCHHFHHAERSPEDAKTPGRLSRKDNATYHRGETMQADLLECLPLLRRRIEDFAVCHALAELQRCASA